MYLTGSKTVSVDAQGRITLPADYRDDFKESGNKVCLIYVKGALWGFTPEGHKEWVESCFPEGFNPRSKKDKALRLGLNAKTVTVEIDKSGRVALGKIARPTWRSCPSAARRSSLATRTTSPCTTRRHGPPSRLSSTSTSTPCSMTRTRGWRA